MKKINKLVREESQFFAQNEIFCHLFCLLAPLLMGHSTIDHLSIRSIEINRNIFGTLSEAMEEIERTNYLIISRFSITSSI